MKLELASLISYSLPIRYAEFLEHIRQWKAWVEQDDSRAFDPLAFLERQAKVEEFMVLAHQLLGGDD